MHDINRTRDIKVYPANLSSRPCNYITPSNIRFIIRYFPFNILRSHPAMHIESFNIHALEGAIHIARSISYVAVAAVCIFIDKTNIFLMSPAMLIKYVGPCPTQYILRFITSQWCARQCILLRSKCLGIPVQYILFIQYVARSWAQYKLTTTDSKIVWNTFNTYCHIRCISLDNTYWIAFFKLL